tara:strand:- start:251 stop:568 length:318 start_codon:yes stop_codon:yes gene_type:complete
MNTVDSAQMTNTNLGYIPTQSGNYSDWTDPEVTEVRRSGRKRSVRSVPDMVDSGEVSLPGKERMVRRLKCVRLCLRGVTDVTSDEDRDKMDVAAQALIACASGVW